MSARFQDFVQLVGPDGQHADGPQSLLNLFAREVERREHLLRGGCDPQIRKPRPQDSRCVPRRVRCEDDALARPTQVFDQFDRAGEQPWAFPDGPIQIEGEPTQVSESSQDCVFLALSHLVSLHVLVSAVSEDPPIEGPIIATGTAYPATTGEEFTMFSVLAHAGCSGFGFAGEDTLRRCRHE